ncbi:MAG TPA: glycosyltransferase, partial [Dehalococcoidia bacterium]|nr:glycosyltransferase [Dehalococcoidia bacterium]
MISIVTLHLQRKEHTERLVRELYQKTEQEFELIVVSQESEAETVAWLTQLQQERQNFEILWNKQNIGTAAGRNLGIRAASGEQVVVVDNDIEVTDGWLQPLIATANKHESIAAVGALILSPQGDVQFCSHYVVEYFEKNEQHSIGLSMDRKL